VSGRRVILYNPRSSANRKPILPMSLLAVGAVLGEERDYVIIDGNLDPDPLPALVAAIGDRPAEAVLCVTVMPGPQLEEAVPLCRELARRHPDLTVVWGGYFPSQHWRVCLHAEYVDFVVRGHGEQALPRLLDHLETGSPALDKIEGIAFRGVDGAPRTNPLAAIPHPDELPVWDLDRVPVERYLRGTFLGRRTVGYNSSYGCPYSCNFCAVVTMVSGRWLAQSAERVAAAFTEYRNRWAVDAVEFVDNNFFVHEDRVAEFAGRVADLGVAWWGEGRIDTMLRFSEETWRAMSASGLKMVFLGAESGSPDTLARMDKGGRMAPEMTLELVRLMARHGIVPELSFVLGNPPDPEQDAARTIEFIRRVKRINPAAEIIMYLYTPVPLEGALFEEARASGFAFPETLDEWVDTDWLEFAQRRSQALPWVDRSLQRRILEFERVLNAYFPTSTMATLTTPKRTLLRAVSAWRYHGRIYRWPVELGLLHRLVAYQRPETSGL
jgi:pyruvate-formate lyase-activating enzyme